MQKQPNMVVDVFTIDLTIEGSPISDFIMFSMRANYGDLLRWATEINNWLGKPVFINSHMVDLRYMDGLTCKDQERDLTGYRFRIDSTNITLLDASDNEVVSFPTEQYLEMHQGVDDYWNVVGVGNDWLDHAILHQDKDGDEDDDEPVIIGRFDGTMLTFDGDVRATPFTLRLDIINNAVTMTKVSTGLLSPTTTTL